MAVELTISTRETRTEMWSELTAPLRLRPTSPPPVTFGLALISLMVGSLKWIVSTLKSSLSGSTGATRSGRWCVAARVPTTWPLELDENCLSVCQNYDQNYSFVHL